MEERHGKNNMSENQHVEKATCRKINMSENQHVGKATCRKSNMEEQHVEKATWKNKMSKNKILENQHGRTTCRKITCRKNNMEEQCFRVYNFAPSIKKLQNASQQTHIKMEIRAEKCCAEKLSYNFAKRKIIMKLISGGQQIIIK